MHVRRHKWIVAVLSVCRIKMKFNVLWDFKINMQRNHLLPAWGPSSPSAFLSWLKNHVLFEKQKKMQCKNSKYPCSTWQFVLYAQLHFHAGTLSWVSIQHRRINTRGLHPFTGVQGVVLTGFDYCGAYIPDSPRNAHPCTNMEVLLYLVQYKQWEVGVWARNHIHFTI